MLLSILLIIYWFILVIFLFLLLGFDSLWAILNLVFGLAILIRKALMIKGNTITDSYRWKEAIVVDVILIFLITFVYISAINGFLIL